MSEQAPRQLLKKLEKLVDPTTSFSDYSIYSRQTRKKANYSTGSG